MIRLPPDGQITVFSYFDGKITPMRTSLRFLPALLILGLFLSACNKEPQDDPISDEAKAQIALDEALAGSSFDLSGSVTITEGEVGSINLIQDFPESYNPDLDPDLRTDVLIQFDAALPAGTQLRLLQSGTMIGDTVDAAGLTSIWLSDAFGLDRTLLNAATDQTYALKFDNFAPGVIGVTGTGVIAMDDGTTDQFEDMAEREEFGTATANLTINERQRDLAMIKTDYGDILIYLYENTPQHKSNFLWLIVSNFYDGVIFHRIIDEFVVQGGDPTGTGSGGPGYTIPAEIVNDHVYGAVGAARLPDSVNPEKESSGSQFYIVDADAGTPTLDGNYTVFGIVIDGMDIVETISEVPTDGDDRPLTDVLMNDVVKVNMTASEILSTYGYTVPE